MKTTKSLFALLLGALAVSFTACKTEEPDVFGKPVRDKDFTVTVTGNNVVAKCSNTAMTSVLWEVNTGVQSTEKEATFYVPIAGEYKLVLSVSNGGDYLSSDTIPFTIAATDVEYYNKGIWKALTGGSNATKHWVLDVEKKFFHNPIDFYGDAEAGLGADGKSWGPWGGTSIVDWGGTPEEGEIAFNALTGEVTVTIDGVTQTGKYNLKVYDRPEDFVTPKLPATTAFPNGPTLWENFLTGKYSYLGSLSSQMGDLKFATGLRFPMDHGRITNDANTTNPSQFLTSDLENVTIMHCTDSSLVVRVKRTYEGDKESKCWLLYNFRVKEYTYVPEAFTYTEPIKTSVTAADLVGTWKYDAVAQDWIGWDAIGTKGTVVQAKLLNDWATGDAMSTTLASWGGDVTVFTTNANNTYVFNADGSCSLNGSANTYSVSNGVITFGTALAGTEWSQVWISLSGTQVKIANPKVGTALSGLWLGQQNDGKNEYKAIHLVKQ